MEQPPYSNQNDPTYTPPGQPYPQTPPQVYPSYPPPLYQPPPKKRRTGLWIALGIIAVLLFACIGVSVIAFRGASSAVNSVSTAVATFTPASGSTPTTAATQAQTGTWTTTHTFKGNGTKKTPIFTVPGDWKILYTCAGFSSGIAGALTVTVYDSNNNIVDLAINADCKANGTSSGETEEHQGGDVYLSVDGTGDWSLKIQELK